MLYIVPTPIGNLKDMTFRAIEVLKSVDLIACEDTRTSTALLNHYEIKNRLVSHHKFNEKNSANELIRLLKEGQNIAIISDAGTPGISDPGEFLKKRCIEEGLEYTVLPGANAVIPAIVMAKTDVSSFMYVGFIQRDQKKKFLKTYVEIPCPVIFYEAANRLVDSLKTMLEVFGNRNVSVIREISKLHEEKFHSDLKEAISHYEENEPKGEVVIVLSESKEQKQEICFEEILEIAKNRLQQGERIKDISKDLSKEYHIDRQMLYKELSK